MTKKLERDLIEHARDKLAAAAKAHVRAGMGPESAARAAIRETQALFPFDWRLAVQGDDSDEDVEVWEVEHKFQVPIACVSRETASARKRPPKRAHATRSVRLSAFHRNNLGPHRAEQLEDDLAGGEIVVRKIGRATKVIDDPLTTYYYRGVPFDQNTSVPSGYYGRWRSRKFATDSLEALLADIDMSLGSP